MIVLKIALLLVKNIFINVKKCVSELWRWIAAKHTTAVPPTSLWDLIWDLFVYLHYQNN